MVISFYVIIITVSIITVIMRMVGGQVMAGYDRETNRKAAAVLEKKNPERRRDSGGPPLSRHRHGNSRP